MITDTLAAATRSNDTGHDVATITDLAVTFERGGRILHGLRGVSLDLRAGEIVGLVGESGSGKSVLGASILGLLPRNLRAVTGSVTVDGVDMVRGNERDRRRVRGLGLGAVFQDPMTSLNPTMRIGKQLREVTASNEESVALLEAVGIPQAGDRLRAFPHELSGGLRQRVMIAIAIAQKPRLIVADEPTTALDVSVQAQILDLLRGLCDDLDIALMFVTHDLAVASQIADRVAVMYGGRLAEVGPAADVLWRPSHPYTQGLLDSRLTMTTDKTRPIRSLHGEAPDPSQPRDACPFGPRCAHHEGLCDNGLPLLRLSTTSAAQTACVRAGTLTIGAEERVDEDVAWPPAVGEHSGNAVVELRGARKTYRLGRGKDATTLHALDGVDLEIMPAESVAVVGLSGCGKSTMLRTIAGLIDLDEGVMEYRGDTPAQIVFQDAGSSLTPWITVGELIDERFRPLGLAADERQERVAETLVRVGLNESFASVRPAQMSGGQRQRAAIARAIAVPPRVLLCDEPTSALDVSLVATVLNMLGRLRRELDMAMVFVTHDLAAARLVSDRIVVMDGGRIVEQGPSDRMTSDPKHPATRALLDALPNPRPSLLTSPVSPL